MPAPADASIAFIAEAIRDLPSNQSVAAAMAASDPFAPISATAPTLTVAAWATLLHGRFLPEALRIRFVYCSHIEDDSLVARYHDTLAMSEIYLDRIFRARDAGQRPVDATATPDVERCVFVRPRRGEFQHLTAEYHRWFDESGRSRPWPLSAESLVDYLRLADRLSTSDAAARVAAESDALPAALQHWILARSEAAPERRPLDGPEFRDLCAAIERIHDGHDAQRHAVLVIEANRCIAVRAAAVLGGMIDTFMAAPFRTPALVEAYAAFHADHLARVARLHHPPDSTICPSSHDAQRWMASRQARIRELALSWIAHKDSARSRLRAVAG